ncbi:hypothetical protein RFI_37365 [Reticulomyxa filosa]|uniref:Uncharacterized protein n=1 Tax=Reticulomyxa filosa TaxID=46433 RepID=X6LH89_RETFI|nr:hypothetical protein RFI_37365 [Reticulomyxa filosa]|eukprot:ETO00095.1 hypothetical protein RFI_37365 [Reticulomyxa filosa]
MVRTFLAYYRNNINQVYEQIIPKSYVISFDCENHKFIFNDPNFIKDILSTKVDQCMRTLKKNNGWVCKSSDGSQGKNVYLYLVNNLDELQEFLLERINPYVWLDYPAQREMEMTLVIFKYIKNTIQKFYQLFFKIILSKYFKKLQILIIFCKHLWLCIYVLMKKKGLFFLSSLSRTNS